MRTKVSSITLLAGILLILVLWGTAAQSATIYVPDNYATIQEAVGAANGGDTIIVRVGTHIIASKLTVPEQINLTFGPGVVVKFGGGCWLRVYGNLIAEGTSNAPIVFTSIKDDIYGGDTNDDEDATAPAKNDWGNILFWDTSDGSILDHVVVKYGGQTYSFPMWQSLPAIHVFTSNLVVSNSTINENGDYGIYVVDASPTILENVITNNSKSGIRLLNASPQIAGNTITGAGQSGISATNSNPIIENNGIGDNAGWAIGLDPSSSGARIQGNALFGPNAGIFVGAGDLETSVTWNSDSVYVIDFYRSQTHNLTVNEGATLTIEPGVVVKFEKSARLFVKGDLIAEGTPEAQIVFTSLKDDSHGGDTNGDGSITAPGKNDWGNIVLWYTSQQSVLDHTVVMYAGQTWSWPLYQSCPAIHVFTPNLVVSNSTITENGVDGIYAFPHVQSNIVIEGNIISKNGRDGIRLYYASARVVGNTLDENRYGIYLTGSPGSEVYLNNFVDNYRHALSTDSVCFWHSDRRSYTYNGNTYTNYLGNYWDDYTGTDAHGDGIGDTPYPIDSDQDSYPLMMPFENYEIGGEEPPEEQWVKVTNTPYGVWRIRKEPGTGKDDTLMTVPDGWVLRQSEETRGPIDEYMWRKVESVAEEISGWIAEEKVGGVPHLVEVSDEPWATQDFQTSENPGEQSETIPVILEAVHHYYSNSDTVNSLYSSNDSQNDFSVFRRRGFPLELILAIAAEESRGTEGGKEKGSGGVVYTAFNNALRTWDGGYGIMQLTSAEYKGMASGLTISVSTENCVPYRWVWVGYESDFFQEYLCNWYSNTRQGIYANIKDGLRALQEKYPSDWSGPDRIIEGLTFTSRDIRNINAVWGYNGKVYTGSYLGDVADRLEDIASYFPGESYDNADYLIEKLRVANDNRRKAKLNSPCELYVTTPAGETTGLVDGQIHIDIACSAYDSAEEAVTVLLPEEPLTYCVGGTSNGTYGLTVDAICDGIQRSFTALDIPTSPGARHVYAVDWEALSAGEEGVILEIDNNGDGFFEQMAIADNELSYDEFALQTETVVDFDPDTLNLKSKGKFVTVYIELPDDFDVSEIDLFSLALNELVPPLPKPIEIGDYDSDGTNDLMVKFDRQELMEVLETGEQIIDITGRLWDGRPIAGFDFIRVIH